MKAIHKVLLSILSAVLLIFSFPNFIQKGITVYTFFFIWVAYIPLLYIMIKEEKPVKVFWYGVLTGFVFYFGGFYWLLNVEPMGVFVWPALILLAAYFGGLMGLSVFFPRLVKEKWGISYLLSVPVIFVIIEFVREWLFSGFPLLTPAQSQHMFLFILQLVKVTGAYGLVYLIIAANTAAVLYITDKTINIKDRDNIISLGLCGLLLVFTVAANVEGKKEKEKITAAILQANINQNVKWNSEYKKQTIETFKELTFEAAKRKPELFIWPETGYPGALNYEPLGVAEINSWVNTIGAYALVGSDKIVIGEKERSYYNSAFMIAPDASLAGDYGKSHLVPFGEYVPLQKYVPFIKHAVRRYGYIGWTPGEKTDPLPFMDGRLGVLICYEMLFPEISRELVKKGAGFLVNISYENWYGVSAASGQLFANTALRAVENNVYLVRCVASGVSGFITNRGKIYGTSGLFEKRALVGEIYVDKNRKRTIYNIFGDWFVLFIFIILTVVIVLNIRKGLGVRD